MTQINLGRLERVDLRAVWENEATSFTPWLAREDNIELLGNAIGLTLEVEAKERLVGPFRADVLCKESETDHWVLIENQLESTDHRHLGQLLTYAAGLHAVTIVWLAESFTEEHRAALDWLNEISGEAFKFFGLEVELWRISDSQIAPKFNVVSKPNDWSKTISGATTRLELTETKLVQRDFWSGLAALFKSRGGPLRSKSPRAQHWSTFAIGRSHCHLTAFVNSKEKWIGLQLTLLGENAKRHFRELERMKSEIEKDVGCALEWEELPEKKESHIALTRYGTDPMDRAQWPDQHGWLYEKLLLFHKVFAERVRRMGVDE